MNTDLGRPPDDRETDGVRAEMRTPAADVARAVDEILGTRP
ncbi:hypothetical protein ACVDFE_05995 [Lentzea chajnantorensis]